jgi:type III secretion system FlhB-like substrate exporter
MLDKAKLIEVTISARNKLAEMLLQQKPVFSFQEEPVLAALCTCLGLQFEMGNSDYDRLSPFFGVEIVNGQVNPWRSEIFSIENKIGIKFSLLSGFILTLKHPDFVSIIDKASFNERGDLDKIIIYPEDVARNFRAKGFDLVIVSEWIMSSDKVKYLVANRHEIESNIATTQIKLMQNRQLAFTGTHDIVDHLLNSDISKFNLSQELFNQVQDVFSEVFTLKRKALNSELLLSYLIGILLDDLAQPKWYGSKAHAKVITDTLSTLKNFKRAKSIEVALELTPLFHELVAAIRSEEPLQRSLQNHLSNAFFESVV